MPKRLQRKKDPAGALKSYADILDEEIDEGVEQLGRETGGLALSGLSAGLDIGFSILLLGVVTTLAAGELPAIWLELLQANAYAFGFMLVVFGRSELFTEHTTLAFLPVFGGRASLTQLARLWGIIYVANLCGGAIFAAILAVVGPELGIVEPAVLGDLARRLLDHPFSTILLSGVLAGWMMGLVSWLVTAGRDTTSELLFVWLVTGAIGFAHLHHCIVGTIEVLAAVFVGEPVTLFQFFRFLVFATIGNVIGGAFFVSLIKYGHASRPGMRH